MATKTQKDVKGVLSGTTAVTPSKIMPTDMENKRLSKDEFIAKRKRMKMAEAAAAKAHAKAMEELGGDIPVQPVHSKPTSQIDALREHLAEIEERLQSDPENAKLLKQRNKLAKELDKAEDAE